jgi:hypothetical protein
MAASPVERLRLLDGPFAGTMEKNPEGAVAMNTYETTATVEDHGQVRVIGVPFAPGTEVEVTISPKRRSAAEFTAAWRQVCAELRARPGLKDITDESIREEIDRHRSAR